MTTTDGSRSAASRQAEAFYNAELRAKLEPAENGKFIIIDAVSRDYEVDSDMLFAYVHLYDRQPDGEFFVFQVGHTNRNRSVLHGMRMARKK